jgi:hypothetical protein
MVTLTETGVIALGTMTVGFFIGCCRQIEQSRCSNISFCWGLIHCDRHVLNDDTVLEMNQQNQEEKKENV